MSRYLRVCQPLCHSTPLSARRTCHSVASSAHQKVAAPRWTHPAVSASRWPCLTKAVPLGRYPAGETKPVSMVM